MNIDLRNISEEFENSVNQVKAEFGISTNSKAVEFCTVHYFNRLNEIRRLKAELFEKTKELGEIKKDVKTLTGTLTRLNKIT